MEHLSQYNESMPFYESTWLLCQPAATRSDAKGSCSASPSSVMGPDRRIRQLSQGEPLEPAVWNFGLALNRHIARNVHVCTWTLIDSRWLLRSHAMSWCEWLSAGIHPHSGRTSIMILSWPSKIKTFIEVSNEGDGKPSVFLIGTIS